MLLQQYTIFTNSMSSITTNTNSRIERNMRNHSNQFIGGKDSHLAMKQARNAQKRGKSDERKRVVSKLRNARDTRQASILDGGHDMDYGGWSELERNFISEPQTKSSFCTLAQANAKFELDNESAHIMVNSRH